ncbi:hypothetical protein [Jiangella rhizosphaerae]|uniref:Uncharacterized protein n=1 Tax=Jiangella rhizosphaerae TaxID=2293569 RepID=A0A418KNK4_9ACTN|nr:hypothetical protein [Jiangella rhizosphaerae]RIQ20540.1 hypothetical protein DY240_17550 [Jiangella rhizosphaerae]
MRGHPVRTALAGIVAMLVVAALPAQIDWADRLGQPERFGDRLRFLTVSPTLLLTERSGWPAYLTELAWAALFAALLVAVSWRLATAIADDWTRPVVFALALPVLAPLAHLVAQLLVHAGGLATDAVGRGERLERLLGDAQQASGHVMLVALAGAVLVLVTHADRMWPREPDGTVRVTGATLLVLLRGPASTLGRRIGLAVLAAVVAYLAMTVVPDVLGAAFEPVARLWCAGGPPGDGCAGNLVRSVGEAPVDPSDVVLDDGRARLVRIYAVQAFLIVFAVGYFQVHAQPVRPRPATTLLAVWYAYTAAVVTHEGVVDAALGLTDEPGVPGVLGLLLPPDGLAHALLSAPAVAVAFAAVHALAARLRRGRPRQPSQPGVTSPAS